LPAQNKKQKTKMEGDEVGGSHHRPPVTSTQWCAPLCESVEETMAPFVYTGAGRKQNPNETDPGQLNCTKQACAIQWCLSRRNHQEEACRDYIDAWKKCCEKARTVATQKPEQLSTKK
jgi:hypothetical protein